MADEKKDVVAEPAAADPITAKDEQIAKLTDSLANYKHVALKRLGKLPGDADFLAGADEKTGLTVEETVKKTLLEGEYNRVLTEKDTISRNLVKENNELRLALKNRPESALGGGGGENLEVKDNVLSEQQIANLKARAERLKVKDVDAFIATAKKNLQNHR